MRQGPAPYRKTLFAPPVGIAAAWKQRRDALHLFGLIEANVPETGAQDRWNHAHHGAYQQADSLKLVRHQAQPLAVWFDTAFDPEAILAGWSSFYGLDATPPQPRSGQNA